MDKRAFSNRTSVEEITDYAIVKLDREGRIVTWNTGARLIFGYTFKEVIGQLYSFLFTPGDVVRGESEAQQVKATNEGRIIDERWRKRKDGSLFWASGTLTAIYDEIGELAGFILVLSDITESKQAELERGELLELEQTSRNNAEVANRLKDQFIATLSHELRNPLSIIIGQAELLLRTRGKNKVSQIRQAAEIIQRNAIVQAEIIGDLLDLSRLRTGKLALSRQPIPLSTAINDAIESVKAVSAAKQITLAVDLAPEPLIVEADSVRVQQIAWNLLSNAIKFTPDGGRVMLRLEKEGEEAKLVVEDTGQGIDPGFLPHVFELYQQGHASNNGQNGGMGIGLALVRQLVELHCGRVEAASDGVGLGARFTVWFPLHRVETHSIPIPATDGVNGNLKGMRILVVDDIPDTVEMMQEILKLDGAIVKTATSGHKALQITETEDFDVILVDVSMPEMDGYELMQKIRELPRTAHLPGIALTGFGRTEDVERAFAVGFNAHMTKPIPFDELTKVVLTTSRYCNSKSR